MSWEGSGAPALPGMDPASFSDMPLVGDENTRKWNSYRRRIMDADGGAAMSPILRELRGELERDEVFRKYVGPEMIRDLLAEASKTAGESFEFARHEADQLRQIHARGESRSGRAPVPSAPAVSTPTPLVREAVPDTCCGKCMLDARPRAPFHIPSMGAGKWIGWTFGLIFYLAAFFVVLVLAMPLVFNGGAFKGACFTYEDMANHVCFFSAGQLSFGIIAVGQASVGLVTLGQASVGLLAAPLGQGVFTLGPNLLGQIVFAGYSYACQLGFGLYKIRLAQVGVNILWPFFGGRTIADCSIEDRNSNE